MEELAKHQWEKTYALFILQFYTYYNQTHYTQCAPDNDIVTSQWHEKRATLSCVSHTCTHTKKVQDTVNVTLYVQGTNTDDTHWTNVTIATVQTSLTASKNGQEVEKKTPPCTFTYRVNTD